MSKSKRDEYVAKMKSELDDVNAEIDKLADKSESAKKDMQAKYKQEMADLRKKSDEASAKLDEMKDASEDQWDKMVAEMDELGDALKHSYNYFKSQL